MGDKGAVPEGYVLKEIETIQNIINRMAYNSFLIKGWAITLVVGSLLLKGDKWHVFIAFIPLLTFWFLDAYFLWQERMYRKLYEWVIANRPTTDENLFDMNAYRFRGQIQSKFRIMFSITLGAFYLSIAALVIIYAVVLLLADGGG